MPGAENVRELQLWEGTRSVRQSLLLTTIRHSWRGGSGGSSTRPAWALGRTTLRAGRDYHISALTVLSLAASWDTGRVMLRAHDIQTRIIESSYGYLQVPTRQWPLRHGNGTTYQFSRRKAGCDALVL